MLPSAGFNLEVQSPTWLTKLLTERDFSLTLLRPTWSSEGFGLSRKDTLRLESEPGKKWQSLEGKEGEMVTSSN